MNGWYSRVDEAPWERRKERRLGTETEENSSPSWSLTVEIKEKYQRAKGGKQQRIQCPLKGQEMLMSFAEKRILSINLQLHCLPAEEWDVAGNVKEKWGWRRHDHDQRPLTCSQGLCQTVSFATIRLLVEHFIFCTLPQPHGCAFSTSSSCVC